MQKIYLGFVLFFLSFTVSSQTLIAGWDFQTTSNGGTATAASPNTPTSYVANVGNGNMYLNNANGSSAWISASSNSELTAFGGTSSNAGGTSGLSTTTSGTTALALLGGTATSANGKFITFTFSMTGLKDLVVSYATQRTSTGFSTQNWEYSIDGSTWVAATTITSIPSAFATTTLNTINGLDNISNAYLRLTVSGATAAAGNNRLDNIQLNATAIVLPVTLTSFSGIKAAAGNLLSWKVVSETAFSQYVVERSTGTANAFKVVSTIAATNAGSYSFIDAQLEGYNYYRLKLVDKDGKSSYSKTVLIINQEKGFAITGVYPTITTGLVRMDAFAATPTKATIRIINQTGQAVYTQSVTLSQATTTNIYLSQLATGNYLMQVLADGYSKTIKLMKQ